MAAGNLKSPVLHSREVAVKLKGVVRRMIGQKGSDQQRYVILQKVTSWDVCEADLENNFHVLFIFVEACPAKVPSCHWAACVWMWVGELLGLPLCARVAKLCYTI